MAPNLAATAFLTPDYDSGLAWFCGRLGFVVLEDTPLGEGRRWVVVADPDGCGARFVIAKAEGEKQRAAIGSQAGGRVGLFLETDDFDRDHSRFLARGVQFLETPRREVYGTVAQFADPWGGKWDLIQPQPPEPRVDIGRRLAIVAIGFVILFLVFENLGSTIAPFVAGIAIGYLLNPVVGMMQRIGFNRLTASLTILFAFVAIVGFAGVAVVPILLQQIAQFTLRLPHLVETLRDAIATNGSHLMQRYGAPWMQQLGLTDTFTSDQIQKNLGDLINRGGAFLLGGLKRLALGGMAALGFLSFLIVTPVVAFYILVDWNKMVATVDSWLPRGHLVELRGIAADIDHALSGFLRGQSLVCLFLGLWYGVGLSLIGLDFSLLIGVAGGLLSFVPYIGSLIALVLSVSVATVQKWPDPTLVFYAIGIVGFGQFLEGYVISPKLVGESIGLHPVWLIFSLFAFGALFGFAGLLVAVPASAVLGVILRHLIRSYRRSPIYRGRFLVPGP